MAKSKTPRPGEADAVDDTGMVQLVGEDGVTLAHERADDADIGLITRTEDQGAWLATERGDLFLQGVVDAQVSAEEPGRATARAELLDGLLQRPLEAGVIGQAQIVIAREVDQLSMVTAECSCASTVDRSQSP